MFKYHSDMGHCFSSVVVVSKKVIFFTFHKLEKKDMVLEKMWLFLIGNMAEIGP